MLAFPLFLGDHPSRLRRNGRGRRLTQVQVHPFNLSQLITQTRNPTAFCALLAFYGDCPPLSQSLALPRWLRCGKRARSVDFGGGVGFYAKIPVKGSNYEATKGDGQSGSQMNTD